MGFFSKILDKLGFDAGEAKVAAMLATPPAPAPAAGAPAAPVPVAIAVVDVVAQLEAKATAGGNKLNWRTSIVDLLKLLDLDSSLAARKELAAELNVRAGADGTAEQNIALHKAVLAKLAANGGNVPADLL